MKSLRKTDDLSDFLRFSLENRKVLVVSEEKDDLYALFSEWTDDVSRENSARFPVESSASRYDRIILTDILLKYNGDWDKLLFDVNRRLLPSGSSYILAFSAIEKQILTDDFLPFLTKNRISRSFSSASDFLLIKF